MGKNIFFEILRFFPFLFASNPLFLGGDFGAKIGKSEFRAAKRPFFASEASPKHREAMRGPEGPCAKHGKAKRPFCAAKRRFEPRSGS